MRRIAKAPSAASSSGIGGGCGLFGRAIGALFAAALLTLVLAAAPAHAAKGWAFKEVFGTSNQPAFSSVENLALDDDGFLYVADSEARTVSRWNPDGTPADFAGLGSNVIDGAAGADATPSGEILNGFRSQIAVDNSGGLNDGNIYATSGFDDAVDVFAGDGTFLGWLTACDSSLFHGAEGVAVGPDGDVYVSNYELPGGDVGRLYKFEPTAKPPVDGDCTAAFTGSRTSEHIVAGEGSTDGYLFVRVSGEGSIQKRDAETGAIEYTFSQRSEMSLDPVTGNLFAGGLELGPTVIEYDASGSEEAIEISELQDAGSEVRAIAAGAGAETLYLARSGIPNVEVWEAVPLPDATVGPPAVLSGAKATVTGTVNPGGVEVTECFFEYGETTAYGQTAPCKEAIPTDENDHAVTAELTGMLAHGTTYNYRLVAKSVGGQNASDNETLKTAETYFTKSASDISQAEATLNGTVRPEGVALTDCRFEWGLDTDYGQVAPCVPHFSSIPTDDAIHAVNATLAGLEPSTTYHYRLVAENSLGQIVAKDRTFSTQGAPGIEAQIASALGQSTATLQARVNPFGSPTTYHFEWGTDETYGNRIPADHELVAGSGEEPVLVNAQLAGLEPASSYHFRLVATNAVGTREGPDHRFETLNGHGLPDNRAFELVSPFDKGTAGSLVTGLNAGVAPRASEEGDSFIWPLQNGLPGTTTGGWLRMKANRGEEGWLSSQLSAPSLIAPPQIGGVGFALTGLVSYASDDLRCGLLETYNPITPDTLQQSVELGVYNLYLWREEGEGVSYELISDRVPLNPQLDVLGSGGFYYTQIEAADDCNRVYFKSSYELIAGASGLYEWDEGTLRDAGVRTDGLVGPDMVQSGGSSIGPAAAGGEINLGVTDRWNAVSPDGRRLFFTAIGSSGKPAVFMRKDDPSCDPLPSPCVVEISKSQTAVPTNGARFEAASPDGSRVFFRANYGIAGTSSPGSTNEACGGLATEETSDNASPPIEAKPCDLYAYDVETGQLSDLSADANPADPIGAAIQGTVAVDEDGSHVYFAALGQLVPGEGRTYAQNVAGAGSANVYLWEGGELSYVTTLSRGGGNDLFHGAMMRTTDSGGWTAETSADGGGLVFESARDLTWYEGDGGRVVYLYDADSGEIACVSCRPDGKPTQVLSNGQVDSVSDLVKLLGYSESRSLSEDGRRIFFTSPDVLMPGAEAGERNVYEWEDGQLYFLAIAERASKKGALPERAQYQGASASGDSAFLFTNHKLAPQDRDSIADVYAVRVDGGFPFVPDPPECQVDEAIPLVPNQIYCQGDPAPQPRAPGPASAGFAGSGNPPESKPGPKRCSKGKVRRRGKCVKRPQRGAKRKRNRAANTNRGGAK